MRKLLCLILLLSAVATAQESTSVGQLLSVRVETTRSDVANVSCDLSPALNGLQLHQDAQGVWTGSFAVLPSLVEGPVTPFLHLTDESGAEVAVGARQDVLVRVVTSDFDQEGLAAVLSDRTSRFVYDDASKGEAVRLLTRDGSIAPERDGFSFVLPAGVAPLNVSAIVATGDDGRMVVIAPEWTTDVAAVEEEY